MAYRPSIRSRVVFELHRLYRHLQISAHPLQLLFWECTLRCNLHCRHCGSDCRNVPTVEDMPLRDFLDVVDGIASTCGKDRPSIALTGGEPLCREDLEQCGAQLTRRGFRWGMVSNGYAMTRDRFNRLMDAGLRSLTISVDGLEESHGWLRGPQDSYQKAMEAVKLAVQRPDLVFDVVTCVNQRNLPDLEPLKKLLLEMGLRRWRLFPIFPKGRAVGNVLLNLSGEQLRQLLEFIVATRREGSLLAEFGCEGFLGHYEGRGRNSLFFCRAGINVGSVLADGSISACPSLRGDYIQGNIYRDDFLDCWNNRFQVMRDRRWTRTGLCANCKAYRWCEGNGLHLRDEGSGALLRCHMHMLNSST